VPEGEGGFALTPTLSRRERGLLFSSPRGRGGFSVLLSLWERSGEGAEHGLRTLFAAALTPTLSQRERGLLFSSPRGRGGFS